MNKIQLENKTDSIEYKIIKNNGVEDFKHFLLSERLLKSCDFSIFVFLSLIFLDTLSMTFNIERMVLNKIHSKLIKFFKLHKNFKNIF